MDLGVCRYCSGGIQTQECQHDLRRAGCTSVGIEAVDSNLTVLRWLVEKNEERVNSTYLTLVTQSWHVEYDTQYHLSTRAHSVYKIQTGLEWSTS